MEDIGNEWTPNLGGRDFNHKAAGQFLSDVEKFCKQSEKLFNGIYSPQQLEEAVWRIPIGDMGMTEGGISFRRRATSSSSQHLQGLLREIHVLTAPDLPADERLKQYRALDKDQNKRSYALVMGNMHNRRPYISKQGYVGVGPISMLPGDAICILLGAQLPYILRKAEARFYKLIGEGYVHGIMDGEYMEKTPERERFILI